MDNFITIPKEDILDYYQDSFLYNDLDNIKDYEDNSSYTNVMEIPKNKYLNITEITTIKEFNQLLEIFQYWGFNKIPDLILKYVFENKDNLNKIELNLYPKEDYYYNKKKLSFGDILNFLIKTKKNKIMNILAKIGYLHCLRYAHENGCPWNYNTCVYAAKEGHLECLKYAHENGCPWDEDTCSYAAARRGTLECIKYAHENGCPWDEETIKSATRRGNLECLKYARENDCPYGS